MTNQLWILLSIWAGLGLLGTLLSSIGRQRQSPTLQQLGKALQGVFLDARQVVESRAVGVVGAAGIIALIASLFAGCATAKPVVRTINDIAYEACGLFYAERQGISTERALEDVCSKRDVWHRFVDEITAAQQRAGEAVE